MIKETHTGLYIFIYIFLLFDAGGDHVHIKSHYRGHHVAVWLQLIPQLHGRLDPSNTNNNNNSDNRTASIDPAVSTHYQQRIRNQQQGTTLP
jgi:hypothetical protein